MSHDRAEPNSCMTRSRWSWSPILPVVAACAACRTPRRRKVVIPCDEANICPRRATAASQAAAGEIVAFIDDDAVPEPTWLNHLVAPFGRFDVAAAGGFVRARNGISWRSSRAVAGQRRVERPARRWTKGPGDRAARRAARRAIQDRRHQHGNAPRCSGQAGRVRSRRSVRIWTTPISTCGWRNGGSENGDCPAGAGPSRICRQRAATAVADRVPTRFASDRCQLGSFPEQTLPAGPNRRSLAPGATGRTAALPDTYGSRRSGARRCWKIAACTCPDGYQEGASRAKVQCARIDQCGRRFQALSRPWAKESRGYRGAVLVAREIAKTGAGNGNYPPDVP